MVAAIELELEPLAAVTDMLAGAQGRQRRWCTSTGATISFLVR